jgi:predicted transposase YbfD/YdcC
MKSGFALGVQVLAIERKVTHKATGKEVISMRWFITSRQPHEASPEYLAHLVRKHWTVENNIHWLKDAVFKEDRSRQRNPNAAQALGLLRTALLAPVRKAGHHSLTHATEDFAANKWNAIQIILRQILL